MHLNRLSQVILPFIFINGLFKIAEIEAVENQKGSTDSKQSVEYDYADEADVSNGEIAAPKSTIKPYFDSPTSIVYASQDVENVTLKCSPKNFNDSVHQILWYNNEQPISNGKTSLMIDKYAVDNKLGLTIFNYNRNTNGNFSCVVLPAEIRQYVTIEYSSPPENIKENSASATKYFGYGFMLTALIMMMSSTTTF